MTGDDNETTSTDMYNKVKGVVERSKR